MALHEARHLGDGPAVAPLFCLGCDDRLGLPKGNKGFQPGALDPEAHEIVDRCTRAAQAEALSALLAGVMEAQYNVLRKHGHSPSEAFNETVEELTQSLIRLVDRNGMDWMYANCSTTAQRGALDWAPRFRDAVAPLFDQLYENVISGKETRRVLECNSAPDYREKLNAELKVLHDSEMWRAGKAVRRLRPKGVRQKPPT